MSIQYRRLQVRWFNHLGCELAQVICFNERDAATQLAAMITDAGCEIAAGDYFKIEDIGHGYDGLPTDETEGPDQFVHDED